MSRAEMRRAAREQKKTKTKTYNINEEQLHLMVRAAIAKEREQIKREAVDDAINTAMILMLTLPLETLKEHYWQKTYARKLPEFTDHVLDYYYKWQNGEIDIQKLRDDLWEYAGVKIEEGER